MTQLSVVVPSSNQKGHLRACLESLKTTLPMSSEVIVVDNASTDGSARMVLDEFPHARLVRNTRNDGVAVAMNQGVEAARGAYVLFLAADTEVAGHAIRSMVGFLERNLRYGAVAPRLVALDGSTVTAHMRFPTLWTPLFQDTPLRRWWPASPELRRHHATDFDYDSDGDVEQPPATCLLMRRKALKRTKPLDESMGRSFHDVDLARRLWRTGWRIGYLSTAFVYHHAAASAPSSSEEVAEFQRDRLAYFRKHHGRFAGAWLKVCAGWSVLDHCSRELWRRAEGLPERSLGPVWQEFQVLLKH